MGEFNNDKNKNQITNIESLDIVLCINCCGCMGHILKSFQENICHMYDDITKVSHKRNKYINNLRVRVVAYRDYLADDQPMAATKFFDFPHESKMLEAFVHFLTIEGGGDEPDDGLEAIAHAIRSDWCKTDKIKRQVIVLITECSTHYLRFGEQSPNYPQWMPRDFDELTDWWENGQYIDNMAKRLIMFAPVDNHYENSVSWNNISVKWSDTVHFPADIPQFYEVTYETVIEVIGNVI